MRNPIGLVILIVGIVLLVYGFSASDSISSGFSKMFTGAPSDKAVWLIIAGAVVAIAGTTMMVRGDSRPR